MSRILMIEDERGLCLVISRLLTERGHTVDSAPSGEAGVAAARAYKPDLILLDLHLEGEMDGIDTLKKLRRYHPTTPIVMISAFGDIHTAVSAMKEGATDFIPKPLENQALLQTIHRLLTPEQPACSEPVPSLVGESPALHEVLDTALKFAVPDVTILLLGETGTGKEVFARMIHGASKRRSGPFVAIDCSMLTESLIEAELFGHEKGSFTGATASRPGRLEMAQGGTLFLDEIGNLPLSFQAKLLRVLQERRLERVGGRDPVRLDVRVISATNANLQEAIRAGTFRQDLYYRLSEMTLELPPLREREGDVLRIAQHFVNKYSARFEKPPPGLTDEAALVLAGHDWPGNVRELENTIKRAVVLADTHIRVKHLPRELHAPAKRTPTPLPAPPAEASEDRLHVELDLGIGVSGLDLKAFSAEAAEQAERTLLHTLLRRASMNYTQLAKMLSVDPKTLRAKLRKYRLETD